MNHPKAIALLYYVSLVGYLALYDLFAVSFPGNMIISFADGILFILFVLFLVYFFKGDLSLPFWRRGVNIGIGIYLTVIILFPFMGYLLHSHSIGVLTSPIRKLQLFLFVPITASFIYEDVINIRNMYIIFLLVSLLHVATGTVRFFGIDEAILSAGFESLLTASTVDDHPTRTAGMLAAIPWFGSLMAVLFTYGIAALYNETISVKIIIPLLTLSLLGIIMAISRTALIMILPGIVVLTWYTVNQDVKIALVGGGLVIGFFAINSITGGGTLARFAEMKNLLTGDLGEISALAARFDLWQSGLAVFEEVAPFGTLVSHSYVVDLSTDSLYLSTLIQSGFVGIGTIVFLFAALLICGISEYMEDSSTFISTLIILITLLLAVGGSTMNVTGFIPVMVVFWIAIGIAIGTQGKRTIKIKTF